jgi:hypothetical protein
MRYKLHPLVKNAAIAAMRLAARNGMDPYNSHVAAADAYPTVAVFRKDVLRSESDANRQLAGR